MNEKVEEIFKRICEELGNGTNQFYSPTTKTHYLYIGNNIIFLIHSYEIGPEAPNVGLYIIKKSNNVDLPTEELITIPFTKLEDCIYRYISKN